MTPFRGRVTCVPFLVQVIFFDELTPSSLSYWEQLLQSQVPLRRTNLGCSLAFPIGWGGLGQVQMFILRVSVDLRDRTEQEAEMPSLSTGDWVPQRQQRR